MGYNLLIILTPNQLTAQYGLLFMISPQYGLLIILSPNQLTAAGVSFPAFAIMRDTLYEASVAFALTPRTETKNVLLLVGMCSQLYQFPLKKGVFQCSPFACSQSVTSD